MEAQWDDTLAREPYTVQTGSVGRAAVPVSYWFRPLLVCPVTTVQLSPFGLESAMAPLLCVLPLLSPLAFHAPAGALLHGGLGLVQSSHQPLTRVPTCWPMSLPTSMAHAVCSRASSHWAQAKHSVRGVPVSMAEGRPTLEGEKAAVALVAVAVGYTLGAAGITPRSLWLTPGALAANPIVRTATAKTFRGGLSGALAGVLQVLSLMWLRTVMNYQYRNGGSTGAAVRALWAEGKLPRFYRGVQYAIVQTPLARFGDTAANTGVLELLAMVAWGHRVPLSLKTAIASAAGSLWRILITPVVSCGQNAPATPKRRSLDMPATRQRRASDAPATRQRRASDAQQITRTLTTL